MLSERLIRFVRGEVRFCVQGGFITQFTDVCRRENINLLHTKIKEDSLTGSIMREDTEKLKTAAQKSGMQLQILKKRGLSFVVIRYRLRWGIPAGICLAFLLFGILSSVVWQVQITGCETLSEEYIRDYFDELGVRPGVFQRSIDIVHCRDRAMLDIKELLWVSVYLKGCIACIEISERKGEVYTEDKRNSNLYAAYGGEIIRADVYAGESYVQKGQAVAQGDLLVGGALPLKNGGVRFVRSQADIVARTNRTLQTEMPFSASAQIIEKSGVRYFLYWFTLPVPLGFAFGMQTAETATFLLCRENVILPIGLVRHGCRTLTENVVQYSEKTALLCCFAEYAVLELQTMHEKTILQRNLTVRNQDGKITVSGAYICEENIVQERELQIEDEN
ncbi:MAG: hypothetical protein E7523_09950 [Ruminococcaceae bacterium]|nr:hypothetical protein [Oscillospiraceae bacterium]